jgi:hypothetical protein
MRGTVRNIVTEQALSGSPADHRLRSISAYVVAFVFLSLASNVFAILFLGLDVSPESARMVVAVVREGGRIDHRGETLRGLELGLIMRNHPVLGLLITVAGCLGYALLVNTLMGKSRIFLVLAVGLLVALMANFTAIWYFKDLALAMKLLGS